MTRRRVPRHERRVGVAIRSRPHNRGTANPIRVFSTWRSQARNRGSCLPERAIEPQEVRGRSELLWCLRLCDPRSLVEEGAGRGEHND